VIYEAPGVHARVDVPARIGNWTVQTVRAFDSAEEEVSYAVTTLFPLKSRVATIKLIIGCFTDSPKVLFDFDTDVGSASPVSINIVGVGGARPFRLQPNKRGDMARLSNARDISEFFKLLSERRYIDVTVPRRRSEALKFVLNVNGTDELIEQLKNRCGWRNFPNLSPARP